MSQKNHKVELDKTSGGHLRLTCREKGCAEKTLVHQPHMNVEAWRAAQEEFLESHPCRSIINRLPESERKAVLTTVPSGFEGYVSAFLEATSAPRL